MWSTPHTVDVEDKDPIVTVDVKDGFVRLRMATTAGATTLSLNARAARLRAAELIAAADSLEKK